MTFQGLLKDVGSHGGTVLFPFGGRVYEVELQAYNSSPGSDEDKASCDFVREEGHAVLQCLTTRAALELQQALDGCGAAAADTPRFELPPIQLIGTFADLVEQLQESVKERREDVVLSEEWGTATADLLVTALKLGHASAAQQLLLIDPRANADEDDWLKSPAQLAALEPKCAPVLQQLLAAAPDLVHSTSMHEDIYGTACHDWTLLHGAASGSNLDAIRLLLQLAPQLATARTDEGSTPLHEAAFSGTPAAVQLLLKAAPETAAAADYIGWLPTHYAAWHCRAANLHALIDGGAPGLDVPTEDGRLPLHIAAMFSENQTAAAAQGEAAAAAEVEAAAVSYLLSAFPAAVQVADRDGLLPLHHAARSCSKAAVSRLLAAHPAAAEIADRNGLLPLHHAAQAQGQVTVQPLLAAYPAAALVQDGQGRTPLQVALEAQRFKAASILLPASSMGAAQLLDAFAAVPGHMQQYVQPLYADLAANMPLTPEQWQRVPAACPSLARVLPAVLARSEAEAALLVAHVPQQHAEQLRTAALSLHRLQHSLQLEVPVPVPLVDVQQGPAHEQLDVAIVGGGPGGLAAAQALLVASPGLRVAVFERSTLRPRGASLAVQPNGIRALEAIQPGLGRRVEAIHVETTERRNYTADGQLLSVAADDGAAAAFVRQHGPYSLVAWHQLQATLAAALPPGVLHQEAAFARNEEAAAGVTLHFHGEQRPPMTAQLLIGADGAQSGVRQQLLEDGPPSFLGSAIWRGVAPEPSWWPGPGTYCIWLQQPRILRAFSLPGTGLVVWQAFAPLPAARLEDIGGGRAAYIQDPAARMELGEARKARALEPGMFGGWCSEATDLISSTDALSVTEHGQFCRSPDACQVWARGRVALLGDAAHLATQFLAQGTSQAFEDALELGRAVGAHGPTPAALQAYQAARQPTNAFVHAQSLQMHQDFQSGRYKPGSSPPLELTRSVELGLWAKRFEPLAVGAAAVAAATTAASAAAAT